MKIEHNFIPFAKRVKHYLLILIGIISVFGLIIAIDNKPDEFFPFMLIISIFFGLAICYKIYLAKKYVLNFYSENDTVKIQYLNYSKLTELETTIGEIGAALINTTTRSGFNFKLILATDDIRFEINSDFDWTFEEMKNLFLFLTNQNGLQLSEEEKFLIERIDNHLLKYPF